MVHLLYAEKLLILNYILAIKYQWHEYSFNCNHFFQTDWDELWAGKFVASSFPKSSQWAAASPEHELSPGESFTWNYSQVSLVYLKVSPGESHLPITRWVSLNWNYHQVSLIDLKLSPGKSHLPINRWGSFTWNYHQVNFTRNNNSGESWNCKQVNLTRNYHQASLIYLKLTHPVCVTWADIFACYKCITNYRKNYRLKNCNILSWIFINLSSHGSSPFFILTTLQITFSFLSSLMVIDYISCYNKLLFPQVG